MIPNPGNGPQAGGPWHATVVLVNSPWTHETQQPSAEAPTL